MSVSTLRWQRLLAVVVIVVMIAASFSFASNNASAKPAPVYQTLKGEAQGPVGFAVSQPLSMLAEKMNAPEIDATATDEQPIKEFVGGSQIPRTAVAQSFNLPGRDLGRPTIEPDKKLFDDPSPSLDWQWAGLSQGVNRAWYSYGVYPPDTQGDISSDHYIQVVNVQMEIWDLNQVTQYTGTPLPLFVGPIDTIWKSGGPTVADCAVSEDGDPVVVYDEYADRWVLSQFALPNYGIPGGPHYECIAVSATADPMGIWYLYQYSFPVMNDYPKFGVWHDAYYMSINQFEPASSPSWRGQGVVAFDKVAMQAGLPASMIYIDTYAACTTGAEIECALGGMLPADSDGTTAPTGPEVFMQFDDDAWGYSGDQLQLWTFVPNFVAGTGTFTHLVDLPTTAFDSEVCAGYSRNCIPQYGTTAGLDAISDRLMYRLHYRNFGTYSAMVVNHTVDVSGAYPKGQAGIRWYELRDTGTGWGMYQQGDIAGGTINRWMGSAAMDSVGNIAIGYSASDATMYPGIRYAVHLASDTLGTMRTEKIMVTGGGAQTGTGYRWGDYSMMSVIPDSPWGGCDMVYTQEYLRGTTAAEWYTWLGWLHNASCYSGDIESPDTLISGHGTAGPGSITAEFTFSGTDNILVSSYECSLDGAAFAACTSPANYTGLSNGAHTFMVRAIDSSGNIDQTPASYTWTVSLSNATFNSQKLYDGYIIESTEVSSLGGLANNSNLLFIGDYNGDRQVKTLLSFDTSSLPDGAVVSAAWFEMRYYGVAGTNPYTTHGPLLVDLANPYFGTGAGILASDFQAVSTATNVATCGSTPTSGWYSCDLTSGFGSINNTGTTQFRLGFTLEDNDDLGIDVVRFYSANVPLAGYAPVLHVTYYVP